MTLSQIPSNYKKSVEWVLGAYTDAGVSFPNGFQKDAIQNAVGARKNSKKWNNWKCDISLINNEKGQFIIVEDFGTVGLTGKNISTEEISAMISRGEELPPVERLARFTSMFNSGGNTSGPGLYGAGKSVYSVASETYTYYYDSLREDGVYVSNLNKCGQVNSLAFEGDEAKEFIEDKTGLSEKTSVGTRVIIEQPKQELLEAIETGEMVSYIQESWWRILQRLKDSSTISVNGIPVAVPAMVNNASHSYELPTTETYFTGYKVKHFGLYTFDNGDNLWSGISYYRKGMKIGEVDIKEVPSKVDGKYWGYVEVDEEWEDGLSEIEDKVHFGVSKGKKNKLAYQYLKNYCGDMFNRKLIEWGYKKDVENADKKLKDELATIAEDIQDLFDKLGFEDLGKGPQKSDFDVRWQDINYPVENSETVTTDDVFAFSFKIRNGYSSNKKFEYKLMVVDPKSGSVVSHLESSTIEVKEKEVFVKRYEHVITAENSKQYNENRIVLSVKVIGSGKEKRKELPFFYDIEKPDNSHEIVDLTLHECLFPVEGSRRVNFDEALKNVNYHIYNKRNHLLSYRLNVSVHNASDSTCPKIMDVASFEGSVGPFEEDITPTIESIVFEKSVFEQYLSEGVLELRARLIANEDDSQFEKGDRITSYYYKIFLNSDEKHGKNDSFDVKSIEAPEDFRRSWFAAGMGRSIILNVGHVAYLNVSDYPEIQHEYLREEMLKQYVLLYLAEGKYDMFSSSGTDFVDLEPQEAAEAIINKIESVYYESLK